MSLLRAAPDAMLFQTSFHFYTVDYTVEARRKSVSIHLSFDPSHVTQRYKSRNLGRDSQADTLSVAHSLHRSLRCLF
jgi:hypothetical protein